jgi:predicted alpha-1,2-mannosidase
MTLWRGLPLPVLLVATLSQAALAAAAPLPDPATDPAAYVNPLIGTANGGNTFPGAVVPFGMVQWSPENTRGDATRRPAPGGYQYDAKRIRGFSLTHLSGTGCRGASGDVPFLPWVGAVKDSPSADAKDSTYAVGFAHANETATAGYYQVRLSSGVNSELTATARTGSGRFTFPLGQPAFMLVRTSDSEVGSSEAQVTVDPATRTVTGSVSSGNFCGYLHAVDRRSYYTLHFVAVFDRPFASVGTWEDGTVRAGATTSKGGTSYGKEGYPTPGKGSGAYVGFDLGTSPVVNVRVGISYVSAANAQANLNAENAGDATFDGLRRKAREAWNGWLTRIQVEGGSRSERNVFYTALYHALLHPNLFSDANGEYWGFDQKAHALGPKQRAQYANFSGWDIYRSQVQLVALLDTSVASDIAQSLLNQADQYNGVWDRWTHNSGATYVMAGDPATTSVASVLAFGATDFDVQAAYKSLLKAATVPTALDLSNEGCPVECRGQRPSLDKWLRIHYIPTLSNSWGGAGETLEDATSDFSLAQLARRQGDQQTYREFLKRAHYWQNVYNPKTGYIQNRNEDGTWPASDPASDEGFAEGSSAQYTWMVPFNPRGLFDAMGGDAKANERLDAFFHNDDGSWALTGSGDLHSEVDNEPSVGAPWLYLFSGKPHKTQETVRAAMNTLWTDGPYGIPGNDDLGAMSSWYVFSAMGMYPGIPGRAEMLLASPLFPRIVVRRGTGKTITIEAPAAAADVPYVTSLRVNGETSTKPWLPESFVAEGGTLSYVLSSTPSTSWGASPADVPPSFGASVP